MHFLFTLSFLLQMNSSIQVPWQRPGDNIHIIVCHWKWMVHLNAMLCLIPPWSLGYNGYNSISTRLRCIRAYSHSLLFCLLLWNDNHVNVCDWSELRQCVYCVYSGCVCVCIWWRVAGLVMAQGSLTLSILTAPAIRGHKCEGSLWLD